MVDAVASLQIPSSEAARNASGSVEAGICVETDRKRALALYEEASAGLLFSPSASPAWIAAWAQSAQPDLITVAIRRNGAVQWMAALEVVRHGPFRHARFLAGRHANGNFPAVAPDTALTAEDMAGLAAIGRARPDIDLIAFRRMQASLGGVANPLLQLPFGQSPDVALAVSLDGGFDAVLGRTSGKRKRKKHRGQTRKYEAAGGFRRLQARTPAEVDRMLDAFFAMKQQRFGRFGVSDVFAAREVREFFRILFTRALAQAEPAFQLHGLEVAGVLRAVTGSSLCGERLICEFGSIREDELAVASPGDFLFYENIKEACEKGFALYDFSVGDEPYKRQWCDVEIRQFDVLMPLSAKGRFLASGMRASDAAKSFLKTRPALWSLVKRARRHVAQDAQDETIPR